MVQCTKCGQENKEFASFCMNCGAKLPVVGALPVQGAPPKGRITGHKAALYIILAVAVAAIIIIAAVAASLIGSGGSSQTTSELHVTILSPTDKASYRTNSPTISLSGTASGDVRLLQWGNSDSGAGDYCTGTTSWYASNIALEYGENHIEINVYNHGFGSASDSIVVTYYPYSSEDPNVMLLNDLGLSIEATRLIIASNTSGYPVDWNAPASGYRTVFVQLNITNLQSYTNDKAWAVFLQLHYSNGDFDSGIRPGGGTPDLLAGQSISEWYAFELPNGLSISQITTSDGIVIPTPPAEVH